VPRAHSARGCARTDEDRRRAALIETLFCGGAVELDRLTRDAAMPRLAPLLDHRLAGLGQRLSVTETGQPFARMVAAAFDAYLPETTGRHSLTV
jgi:oxygen-independent coproporphyrinogen-3 oxidase